MIIENPTHDSMMPFLGRHVTINGNSGRLACLMTVSPFYMGVASGVNSGGSTIEANIVGSIQKIDYIGPKDIRVTWIQTPKKVMVHEPVNPIKPEPKSKLVGLMLLPLLIGIFKR